MNEQDRVRLKCGTKGALLCLFFCSLAYSLSAVFFSELKNLRLSSILMLVLSFVSAATYLLLEITVFLKTKTSSFAIGYFGTFALISAAVFFITSILPMNYIFDVGGYYTAIYFRQSMIRLCLINAAALVIRLGLETGKYVNSVINSEN